MRGCPWRYRGGEDRPCPDHDDPEASMLLRMATWAATGETAGTPGEPEQPPNAAPASTNGRKQGRKAWFELGPLRIMPSPPATATATLATATVTTRVTPRLACTR
jgi:hypothetical protein